MTNDRPTPTRPTHVLEDPSATAVARVYSEAFLDAAGGDAEGAIEEFTSFMDDVLAKNPEFEALITSPYFNKDDKRAMIDRIVGPFGSERFTSFLRVLARHERLDLLHTILYEIWLLHESRLGQRRVQVRTAIELSDEQLENIRRRLDGHFPFEPILVPGVDPSLLGGIVIQVGDTVYDGSLRSRMRQLARQLRQRSVQEIQAGRARFSAEQE